MKRLSLAVFLSTFLLTTSHAQQQVPVEMQAARQLREIPESTGTARAAVIVSTPEKTGWDETARKVHNQLKGMRLDVVMYIHYMDFAASPGIKRRYIELLKARRVENIFLIRAEEARSKLLLAPRGEDMLIDLTAEAWYADTPVLNDALYELALTIKRMGYETKNFLIPDAPEIFEDIPLIQATEFPSYPTQLKRLPVGVTRFTTLPIDSANLTTDQIVAIKRYNDQQEEKNRQLEAYFANYPYKYEMVDPMTDEEAYKAGFQFILKHLHTSGRTIKKLLNYESASIETDYITVVPLPGGKRTMKTIPVETQVYKWYLKQTIANDAYLGRYWDADQDWQKALDYYFTHMINEFND
jgi:hypothetical protein